MKIGRVSENIYNRSIKKFLAQPMEKSIIFVDSLAYDTIDLGYWAVHRGLNGLGERGVKPTEIQATILLPTTQDEPDFRQLIQSISETCKKQKVSLVEIKATVTPTVTRQIVNTTVVGKLDDTLREEVGRGQFIEGQDIVMTNWMGLEGTSIIASKGKMDLCSRFPTGFVEAGIDYKKYASVDSASRVANREGVRARYSLSDGGIVGGLWALASASDVGLEIYMKDIPVKQETVELCEYYDLNPYELASCGCLLLGSNNGIQLVHQLQKEGIQATVIGKTTSNNDRVLLNDGERRFIEPTKADQLYQVVS